MRLKHFVITGIAILVVSGIVFYVYYQVPVTDSRSYKIGQAIDSLNGVKVYYNGAIGNVSGRNIADGHYNLGLKYQCVEFVKRYYYKHLDHEMPETYGHAKSFFDKKVEDGELNKARGLVQFTNPGVSKPKVDDLIVFEGTSWNPYGHVAIIAGINDEELTIIQQNPGPNSESRINISIDQKNGKWHVDNSQVLGWLRKP